MRNLKLNYILYGLAVIGLIGVLASHSSKPTDTSRVENTFERMVRTNTLRCGYISYAPEMIIDPATGRFSGIGHNIMAAIGQATGLKIIWAEEVSTGTMLEGLRTNRYDAICATLYEKPMQALQLAFSTPINYSTSYAYARQGYHFGDNSLAALNNPDVTIAIIDGEISANIAHDFFPQAKLLAMPQNVSSPVEALTAVANGKADIAFSQQAVAAVFIQHNPHQVAVFGGKPVSGYSQSLVAMQASDLQLKNFFDSMIRILYANGVIPHILKQYDPAQTTYLPLAIPYQQ